jgi:hypothetical protein
MLEAGIWCINDCTEDRNILVTSSGFHGTVPCVATLVLLFLWHLQVYILVAHLFQAAPV